MAHVFLKWVAANELSSSSETDSIPLVQLKRKLTSFPTPKKLKKKKTIRKKAVNYKAQIPTKRVFN